MGVTLGVRLGGARACCMDPRGAYLGGSYTKGGVGDYHERMLDPADNDVILGRDAIRLGHLHDLRVQLGLSQAAMADLIDVDASRYRFWEREPDTRLWAASAHRIGRFYRSAMRQVGLIEEMGYAPGELMPFMSVAPLLGMTHELLIRRYRNGEITGVDLGVLGIWMTKDQYASLAA